MPEAGRVTAATATPGAPLRQGTKLYFTATVVSQVVALARYVILARLLGPTELGFAAILLLTSQFFESVSDTGSDRFIVQDSEGDTEPMQRLVHLAMAGRGLLIAIVLVASSALLAGLYHSPVLAPALSALGLAPLIAGFVHLDVNRVQRHGDFRPEGLSIILSEIASLVGTVTAAAVTHDHTAVIYGLVLKSIVAVSISHVTSKRPYRWGFYRQQYAKFAAFAAPLFMNGLLLFAGSQGDRVVIGSHFGPTVLGQYSAILLLILYPGAAISRFIANTHMPQLSASRDNPERFRRETELIGGRTMLIVAAMAIGFTILGPIFAPILYGPKFHQPATLFALLAVFHTNRVLRIWPTAIAISIGRSFIVMMNNAVRILALPAAVVAAIQFRTLNSVVWTFIVGEVLALAVLLLLLARAKAISGGPEFARSGLFLLVSICLCSWSWFLSRQQYAAIIVLVPASLIAGALVLRRERLTIATSYAWLQAAFSRRRIKGEG